MAIWQIELNIAKKIPQTKKENPQDVGNTNLPLPFQKFPFQEFHFSIHKCFSLGTFIENLIRYQFLTKCFYKFRKGDIPSQSTWNGREHQGYSIIQQEHYGELPLGCLSGMVLSDSSTTEAWGLESDSLLGGKERIRKCRIHPAGLKHMWNLSGSQCSINITRSRLIYCYLFEADSKASSMDGCDYGNIHFRYKHHFLTFIWVLQIKEMVYIPHCHTGSPVFSGA